MTIRPTTVSRRVCGRGRRPRRRLCSVTRSRPSRCWPPPWPATRRRWCRCPASEGWPASAAPPAGAASLRRPARRPARRAARPHTRLDSRPQAPQALVLAPEMAPRHLGTTRNSSNRSVNPSQHPLYRRAGRLKER